MHHGGPEIVNCGFVFDGVVAEVVGRTVNGSAFYAAAGHPDGEPVGVMIATIASLGKGRATEFAGPDDECFLKQASTAQILNECCDGLIDLVGHGGVAFLQFAVLIPRIGRTPRHQCRASGSLTR